MAIALHLETLAKIHQALVDLPSFGQRSPRSLRIPGALRTCESK